MALAVFAAGIALALWQTPGLLRTPTPLAPAAQARQILDMMPERWVEMRPMGQGVVVYFTSLVTARAALRAVQYGLNTDVPDRGFPLPAGPPVWPQPITPGTTIYVDAPGKLRVVSVRLTYADGSTSPVRIFRVGDGS